MKRSEHILNPFRQWATRMALLVGLLTIATIATPATPSTTIPRITWDKHSLMVDGRRIVPVMGEVH